MLRKSLYIFLLTLLIGFFSIGFGQTDHVHPFDTLEVDNYDSLQSWKQKKENILFNFLPFHDQETLEDLIKSERNLISLQNISDKVSGAKQSIEGQNTEITDQINSFSGYLDEVKETIKITNRKIRVAKNMLSEYTKQITKNLERTKSLEIRVAKNRRIIKKYINYIFTQSDTIYTQSHDIDLIRSVVFNDSNTADVLNDIYIKQIISITGQALIEENDILIYDLEKEKEELEINKIEKEKEEIKLSNYKRVLDAQVKHQEQLLLVAEKRGGIIGKNLAKIQKSETEIISSLKEAITQYQNALKKIYEVNNCNEDNKHLGDCRYINQYFEAEKQLYDAPKNFIHFKWPLLPDGGISSLYHDGGYYDATNVFHDGIDIIAPQGTPIGATHEGYVYALRNPAPGDYGFVAIKHANGFISLYGHVSEIYVNRFDWVETNEIFAASGGERGAPGSGIFSTNPHLHFEIYREKKLVDPLDYLNLAILEAHQVPTRYAWKYLSDSRKTADEPITSDYLHERTHFLRFKGDTELERQKYLLSTYAHPAFQAINPWIQSSTPEGIDPSFVICIALSETGLGRNLKTPYNVGNIGNTDSGSTYQYTSALGGISAIPRTLNNQYLGAYTQINELSRWGNPYGSIYASHPHHWHNNVLKCLQALKEQHLFSYHNFRIDPMTPQQYYEKMRIQN